MTMAGKDRNRCDRSAAGWKERSLLVACVLVLKVKIYFKVWSKLYARKCQLKPIVTLQVYFLLFHMCNYGDCVDCACELHSALCLNASCVDTGGETEAALLKCCSLLCSPSYSSTGLDSLWISSACGYLEQMKSTFQVSITAHFLLNSLLPSDNIKCRMTFCQSVAWFWFCFFLWKLRLLIGLY